MPNPFLFIVGCPRSGTTLLRRLVDAHAEIAVVPEVGWLAGRYTRRDGLTPDGLVTPVFVSALLEKGGFGRYTPIPLSRAELERLLEADGSSSYADLIACFFDRYGEVRGKRLVGNKTVDLIRSVSVLHELWPHAKIVHLIRDGRDVCLSAISWRRAEKLASRFPSWRDDPVSTAAAWWEWHVRPGAEAGVELGPKLYYEVRYEALVANPGDEAAALCRFLGVAYDEAMTRFYEGRTRDGQQRLDAKHAWLPATPGLRNWRSQMNPDDVARFEAVAGDLLDELGYPRGAHTLSEADLNHAARIRSVFERAAEEVAVR